MSKRPCIQKYSSLLAAFSLAMASPQVAKSATDPLAGELDPTFGTRGKVMTDFRSDTLQAASDVAVQPDGKLVVTARTGYLEAFQVLRYHPDGRLDASFDGDGRAETIVGKHSHSEGLALQADGKIVVAGTTFRSQSGNWLVARYLPDGSLDPDFGDGGTVITRWEEAPLDVSNDAAVAVAIDSAARIVVGGTAALPGLPDFAVARYLDDGSLDRSFGLGGKVLTNIGLGGRNLSGDELFDLAITSDGHIVAGGVTTSAGLLSSSGSYDFALVRYLPGGIPDPTFGVNGRVVTDFGGADYLEGVAVDGTRIVAAGVRFGFSSDVAAARYTSSGDLDPDFADGGRGLFDIHVDGVHDTAWATDISIARDGYVLAGLAGNPLEFAVARLTRDGTLDPTFNGVGYSTTGVDGRGAAGNAVAIQADGRIVVAGRMSLSVGLARYLVGPPRP